ncbi:MAG: hypothetical protein H8E66_12325 [Planctomycetes bacterium]|nr:hypothetical protein [Planctomycetota bacterium]
MNLLAAAVILLLPTFSKLSGGFPEGLEGFVEGKATFAEATFVSIIIASCSFVSGILLVLGAVRMFDLQSYGIALIAAVVAILPCALGFPISLPFGIWALIVVLRHDVKNAFPDEHAKSERKQTPTGPVSVVGGAMVGGMIVGMVLGTAVDQDKIGEYMVLGMVVGLLLGCVIDANNRGKSKD